MVKAKTTETATAAKAPKTPAKKAAKAETKPAAKAAKAAPKEEAAAPAEEAPAAAAAAPEIDGSLIAQSGEFLTKLQQVSALLTSLKTEYRALEKKWTRTLTVAQKQNSKRKRKASTRSPSGFVKPTRISDELASFLSQPSGVEMARTDVTRSLNAYIREHNLQDKENGRKINPDQKLAKLLKVGKDDTLTYFNLQRYMSPHFAKAAAAATSA
jgi:chromatin remodeling complex protein RSC6